MKWRSAARELLIVLFFVILTILNTWPLILNPGSAVSDPGDPYLVTWILEWNWWAVTHAPLSLFHAPIFHPSRYAFAFSEHMFGVALPLFPLYAAGVAPLTIYSIAVLLGFALSGYGAFVLARMLTQSWVASVCAGIFFAFVPFRMTHLPHLPHIWAASLPLLLAALIHHFRKPSWPRALVAGAAFLWNGLSNIHWLFFGGLAFFLSGVFLLLSDARARTREFLVPLFVSVAAASLLLLPFLLPYRSMSKLYGIERNFWEAKSGSAQGIDWFISSPPNKTYGHLANVKRAAPERALFPGVLSLLLLGAALLLSRREDFPPEEQPPERRAAPEPRPNPAGLSGLARRWIETPRLLIALDTAITLCLVGGYYQWSDEKDWNINFLQTAVVLLLLRLTLRFPDAWGGSSGNSLRRVLVRSCAALRPDPVRWRFPVGMRLAIFWTLLGVLGSRGVRMFFYRFLFEHVYGFRSIRAPVRMAMVAYVGLSVLIAIGVVALLSRVRPRLRPVVGSAMALLFLAELRAAPIRWYLALPQPPPVYSWLAGAPISGAVAELPFGNQEEAEYVLRQTAHHRPLVNGVSGYYPEIHEKIARLASADPVSGELITMLERIGCSLLVVHNDRWDLPRPIREWLKQEVAANRLVFLRRFEHDVGGDYVLALARVEPAAAERLRGSDRPDVSGLTPAGKFEKFLAGEPHLYNESTFGWLDEPKNGADVRGRLRVSGWALSPHGVKGVNLRFENGQVVVPAALWPWEEVKQIYPWYPRTTTPGFLKEFSSRPAGISAETDLQVEIIDGTGSSTRLEQISLRWLPRGGARFTRWNDDALDRLLTRLGFEARSQRAMVIERTVTIEQLVYAWSENLSGRSDEEFLESAFRTLLGRKADPNGRAFYLEKLRRGESRREILDAFLRSDEFTRIHSR